MKTYECECPDCQSLCKLVPCMGTPKEIQEIIDKGYGYNSLVVSTNNDPSLDFTVVKPKGSKEDRGQCTFYKKGKCILHDVGLKPIEGRVAMHKVNTPRLLYHHLARAWNTRLGRELVKRITEESQ